MNIHSKHINRILEKKHGIKKKEPILISFSGGPDSLFLTEYLLQQNYQNLSLIYFNHHLRPLNEINKDITVCKNYAKKNRLPLTIKSLPIKAFIQKYHISEEEAGHVLRRSFLKHIASLKKYNIVMTGHHQDDQIETILMHLKKGIHNLQLPIKEVSHLNSKIKLLRPLLNIKKVDILNYLYEHNLNIVNDISNLETKYLRNHIRQKWIPFLNQTHPSFLKVLLKTCKVIEKATPKTSPFLIHITKNRLELSIKNLSKNKDQISQQLYQMCQYYYSDIQKNSKKKLYFLDYHISAKHIELIQTLLNKEKTGHYINLPGNHICYRSNKTLIFMHQKELNKDITFSISVKQINKIYEIPVLNHKIKFTLLTTSPLNIKSSKTSAYIQLDPKKPIHFIIRSLTHSDEYKPYGKSYSKNIWDYLSNQQCDWFYKKRIPVIQYDETIAWVCGYSIADQLKVSSSHDPIIRIDYIEHKPKEEKLSKNNYIVA